jgi:hypothetical protein
VVALAWSLVAIGGAAWAQSVAPVPLAQPAAPVQTAPAQPAAAGPVIIPKRIFAVPPLQWDADMLSARSALHETSSDLANLTAGIIFGLSPTDVDTLLPDPAPGVSWNSLPAASEFPEDVRYFWTRLAGSQDLQAGISTCAGANSYIVFLFRSRGLFRISYRFVPDAACPDPSSAVAAIFARYLLLGRSVALAVHYRSGGVHVVDVSDPTADYLIPMRWQNRAR